jgi:hypothetical protein
MKNLKLLLEDLESALPENETLNQALIKTLRINKDAASRRISGKTPFTYDEVCELSKHYGISLSPAQTNQFSNVVFAFTPFKSKAIEDSKHFFQTISSLLFKINTHEHKLLYHVAPEVPVYHYYNYPRLLNFKLFYWGKYLLNNEYYMKRVISESMIDNTIIEHAAKAYEQYCMIPSIEIWTPQTIQTVLTQIHFCIETGDFTHRAEIDLVLEEVSNMVQRIKQMAEENNKAFDFEKKLNVPFQFYKMDVNINTTSILAEMDHHKVVLQPFNSINFMNTTQPDFCEENLLWIQNIQSKSSLLSGAGIIERQKYFSNINKQINEFREQVHKKEF